MTGAAPAVYGDPMGTQSLTTGILGLNEQGRRMLRAAAATGCFQIKAVADQDQQKADKTAREYDCQAYSDYRQLIVRNQLDCLLVAAEAHSCDEQLKAAIRRKFNILKLAPPARTFEEALEYTQLAESEGVAFVVANPARTRSSYIAARTLLSEGRLEHVFLIAACCNVGVAERPAWRIDPKLAGGGVLLHDCYGVIDQILWNFPLPEQVYALKTNQAPDKQQRLCLTEDTAVVCMRFSDALMGSLIATRRQESGPNRTAIEIHAKQARVTVTDQEVVLVTQGGQGDRTWQYNEDEQVVMERVLSGFAQGLVAPQGSERMSTAREHLRHMAVLESAYLSARTGFPEEPARILQLGGSAAGAAASI